MKSFLIITYRRLHRKTSFPSKQPLLSFIWLNINAGYWIYGHLWLLDCVEIGSLCVCWAQRWNYNISIERMQIVLDSRPGWNWSADGDQDKSRYRGLAIKGVTELISTCFKKLQNIMVQLTWCHFSGGMHNDAQYFEKKKQKQYFSIPFSAISLFVGYYWFWFGHFKSRKSYKACRRSKKKHIFLSHP